MIYLHLAYHNSGENLIRNALLRNRGTLFQNNILYPQATLIDNSHENIYYELMDSKLFKPDSGTISTLTTNILEYKLKHPNCRVILSSSKLIHAPMEKLYKFIGILGQLDRIKIIVTTNSQFYYLRHLWSRVSDKPKGISFKEWAIDCINNNYYGLNYLQSIQKIERLINEKNIQYFDTSELNDQEINKKYLGYFQINDRRKFNLSVNDTDNQISPLNQEDIMEAKQLIDKKFEKVNLFITNKYSGTA